MTTLLAAAVGLVAGLHAATWGMYKDAPHEGFSVRKYARSPLLGLGLGALVQALTGLDPRRSADLVLLFGVIYAAERALAEIYKTFLREEDQAKYFIPMQFHVLGRVVRSRPARWLVGALYTAGLAGMAVAVGSFAHAMERPPALATLFAAGLSLLSHDLLVVTLAAAGFTIAGTETYKTFAFPSKPRGKFAGMPVHYPEMLRYRRHFVPVYVAIWAAVLAAVIGATHG